MMFYAFVLILILILFMALTLNKFDIINPAILYLCTWIFSGSFAAIYSPNWGITITIESILLLLICICSFIFPALLLGLFRTPTNILYKDIHINISFLKCVLVFIYIVLSYFVIINILETTAIELGYNPENESVTLLEFLRYQTTHNDDVSMGKLFPHLLRINFALGCITFYFLVHYLHSNLKGIKLKKLILVLSSILSIIISILSTGRTMILAMIIAYLMIYLLLFAKYKGWRNNNNMISLALLLILIPFIFIILFILIGFFVLNRFGDGTIDSIFSNIAIYISSSLVSFSEGLSNISSYPNGRFGEYTFNSIYGTLKTLGFINDFMSPFIKGISIDGWNSNIYTSNLKFILDFGIGGAILLNFFLGTTIGLLYRLIKKHYLNNFYIISLYSILMFGILMSFFDEQFFLNLNNFIFRWLYLILTFLILKEKTS